MDAANKAAVAADNVEKVHSGIRSAEKTISNATKVYNAAITTGVSQIFKTILLFLRISG